MPTSSETITVDASARQSSLFSKRQATLCSVVRKEGRGLFSGEMASVTFVPAPLDHGIVFKRTDLTQPCLIKASCQLVQSTPRCTILGSSGVTLQTVEHVLAAIYSCGIDNLLIEVSGPELPIFDGSSLEFVEMIKNAGIEEQADSCPIYHIDRPLFFSENDVHIVALPSNEFRISYTLHYPTSELIGTQFASFAISKNEFIDQISSCRTFSLYEEIIPFIERGLLKGGSLDNAVLIKDNQVMNPDGLRFSDEMVRHKILDMIGDLSLVGFRFHAHIVAVRAGHYANSEFAKRLFNYIKMESI